MSQSKSLKKQSERPDFSGLSRFDVAALVANTALVARDSGHQVMVRHAKVQGESGILIFIPGFELKDGNLTLVANDDGAAEAVEPATAITESRGE